MNDDQLLLKKQLKNFERVINVAEYETEFEQRMNERYPKHYVTVQMQSAELGSKYRQWNNCSTKNYRNLVEFREYLL